MGLNGLESHDKISSAIRSQEGNLSEGCPTKGCRNTVQKVRMWELSMQQPPPRGWGAHRGQARVALLGDVAGVLFQALRVCAREPTGSALTPSVAL